MPTSNSSPQLQAASEKEKEQLVNGSFGLNDRATPTPCHRKGQAKEFQPAPGAPPPWPGFQPQAKLSSLPRNLPVKRYDGDPLGRADVQHALLCHLFSDTRRVFTNPRPGDRSKNASNPSGSSTAPSSTVNIPTPVWPYGQSSGCLRRSDETRDEFQAWKARKERYDIWRKRMDKRQRAAEKAQNTQAAPSAQVTEKRDANGTEDHDGKANSEEEDQLAASPPKEEDKDDDPSADELEPLDEDEFVQPGAKLLTFKELYIESLLNSGKCTKSMRDKMVADEEYAEDFAKVCLLVNVGRINTTLAFYPEMKTVLRSYHPLPSVQHNENTKRNMQDAPRMKSLLKAVLIDTERPTPPTAGQPSTKPLQSNMLNEEAPGDLKEVIKRYKAGTHPPTSVVTLVFLLSLHANEITSTHFPAPYDAHSLFYPHAEYPLSSKQRAEAFLWLLYHYLEGAAAKPPGEQENLFYDDRSREATRMARQAWDSLGDEEKEKHEQSNQPWKGLVNPEWVQWKEEDDKRRAAAEALLANLPLSQPTVVSALDESEKKKNDDGENNANNDDNRNKGQNKGDNNGDSDKAQPKKTADEDKDSSKEEKLDRDDKIKDDQAVQQSKEVEGKEDGKVTEVEDKGQEMEVEGKEDGKVTEVEDKGQEMEVEGKEDGKVTEVEDKGQEMEVEMDMDKPNADQVTTVQDGDVSMKDAETLGTSAETSETKKADKDEDKEKDKVLEHDNSNDNNNKETQNEKDTEVEKQDEQDQEKPEEQQEMPEEPPSHTHRMFVPALDVISYEQAAMENIDTEEEIKWGKQMQSERAAFLSKFQEEEAMRAAAATATNAAAGSPAPSTGTASGKGKKGSAANIKREEVDRNTPSDIDVSATTKGSKKRSAHQLAATTGDNASSKRPRVMTPLTGGPDDTLDPTGTILGDLPLSVSTQNDPYLSAARDDRSRIRQSLWELDLSVPRHQMQESMAQIAWTRILDRARRGVGDACYESDEEEFADEEAATGERSCGETCRILRALRDVVPEDVFERDNDEIRKQQPLTSNNGADPDGMDKDAPLAGLTMEKKGSNSYNVNSKTIPKTNGALTASSPTKAPVAM